LVLKLLEDITIITTHTSKPQLIQHQMLKLLLMPVPNQLPKLPLKLRKPSRRPTQLLKMLRRKLLLSLNQRLLINQPKPKEPGPRLDLMMPLRMPQLLTTMLLVKKSSLICIEQELKIN